MVEKGLLCALVAILMVAGFVFIDTATHEIYTELNCRVAQATLCIIDEPNKETMND